MTLGNGAAKTKRMIAYHDRDWLTDRHIGSNRDLPLQMPVGKGKSDFSLEVSAPVEAVRCIRGPTRPRPSLAHQQGEVAWRLVNHLSLNYLSLLDSDGEKSAAMPRQASSASQLSRGSPWRQTCETRPGLRFACCA